MLRLREERGERRRWRTAGKREPVSGSTWRCWRGCSPSQDRRSAERRGWRNPRVMRMVRFESLATQSLRGLQERPDVYHVVSPPYWPVQRSAQAIAVVFSPPVAQHPLSSSSTASRCLDRGTVASMVPLESTGARSTAFGAFSRAHSLILLNFTSFLGRLAVCGSGQIVIGALLSSRSTSDPLFSAASRSSRVLGQPLRPVCAPLIPFRPLMLATRQRRILEHETKL